MDPLSKNNVAANAAKIKPLSENSGRGVVHAVPPYIILLACNAAAALYPNVGNRSDKEFPGEKFYCFHRLSPAAGSLKSAPKTIPVHNFCLKLSQV